MKNERRSIVVGQAVDDLPDAGVHFVHDDSFIDKAASIRQFIRLAHVDDTELAVGLMKIIGGRVCGDRERPCFDTCTATKGVEPFSPRCLSESTEQTSVLKCAGCWRRLRRCRNRATCMNGSFPVGLQSNIPRNSLRAQLNGVSKGGEHPLWSSAGSIPRRRNAPLIEKMLVLVLFAREMAADFLVGQGFDFV
jgi:hypothetical protein